MVVGKRHADPEYVTVSLNKRILRVWILAIAIILIIFAIARPYWGYKLLPFSGSGRDILAVVDVSKSMLSKDIQPSRLAHAKHLLQELITNTPGDRYGIIDFAGSAFLECPLTIDRTSLFTTLKDINVNSIPQGGTNIERALGVAIKAFKAAAGGYKAIIIITDGGELQGNVDNAINSLKKLKVPLLVVGIGDPSKPGLIQIAKKDGQTEFLRDSKGELVKSKLNEPLLEKLAKETNGIYVRSTAVDPGLTVLEKRIDQLIPEKYKDGQVTRPLEKFQIPLLAAILLIFLWLALGEKKPNTSPKKTLKNKNLVIIILLFCFFATNPNISYSSPTNYHPASNIQHTPPPLPSKSYGGQAKNPLSIAPTIATDDQAKTLLTDAKSKAPIPELPTAMFNMGVKKQSKGDVKEAQKYYTKAINLASKKDEVRSKAYQNMGVIQHTAARQVIMQNPEESLKLLDKAENLYKGGMRTGAFRENIAINQQILLNDRKKAKEIIKQRKEMQKKRQEAKKKTQEAQDKQQQAKDTKDQKQQQQKQNEAKQKTQEAQKAVQDYKKSAQKNQSQKDMQDAQGAENDIKNAQQSQQQGENDKAEENLKQAVKKLSDQGKQQSQQQNGGQGKQNQQQKNQQNQTEQKIQDALNKQKEANKEQNQQQKQQKQQEANKKTQEAQKANKDYKNTAKQNNSRQDEQKAEQTAQNLKNAQDAQQKNDGKNAEKELKKALGNMKKEQGQKQPQKELPKQPGAQPKQPKYDNKDIDPNQADALLKLMANDEKPLKDELKKRQKEAYGNVNVDKDW